MAFLRNGLQIVLAALLSGVLAIASLSQTTGGAASLPAGQLIAKVTCKDQPAYSYALYLPSNYTANRTWPIIYCFDPGASGSEPIKHFQAGAEKYGYIVVGSNDSKNGPGLPATSIARALFQDTQSRFSVDGRQVYLSGFSGGARLASAIALAMPGAVAGVIACSAGFLPSSSPPRPLPFPFFGTAGIEDFNYPEMYSLAELLTASGSVNRLAVFDGPHSWPLPEVCTLAIQWMRLQAMRAGRLEKDEAQIQSFRREWSERAKADEAAGKPYEAYLEYSSLTADFAGLSETADFRSKAGELRQSKEVKQALKQEKENIEKQRARMRELATLNAGITRGAFVSPADAGSTQPQINSTVGQMGTPPMPRMGNTGNGVSSSESGSDDQSAALVDLKHTVASLKKASDGSAGSPARIVARRVLSGYLVGIYETSEELIYAKAYGRAVQLLTVATIIRPESQGFFLELAKAYTGWNQKGKAIEALKRAVANGFKDASAIERDPDFEPLRSDPEYKSIVSSLAGSGEPGKF